MLGRTQYVVTQRGISEVVICRCVISGFWLWYEKRGGVVTAGDSRPSIGLWKVT